jgi:hypothetical protein
MNQGDEPPRLPEGEQKDEKDGAEDHEGLAAARLAA